MLNDYSTKFEESILFHLQIVSQTVDVIFATNIYCGLYDSADCGRCRSIEFFGRSC